LILSFDSVELDFELHFHNSFLGGTQEPFLSQREQEYLLVLLEQNPTLYIWEMRLLLYQHLGITVSDSTIARTLEKLGVTKKKLGHIHEKRFTEENLLWRLIFLEQTRTFPLLLTSLRFLIE
jgi:hypothetical protein